MSKNITIDEFIAMHVENDYTPSDGAWEMIETNYAKDRQDIFRHMLGACISDSRFRSKATNLYGITFQYKDSQANHFNWVYNLLPATAYKIVRSGKYNDSIDQLYYEYEDLFEKILSESQQCNTLMTDYVRPFEITFFLHMIAILEYYVNCLMTQSEYDGLLPEMNIDPSMDDWDKYCTPGNGIIFDEESIVMFPTVNVSFDDDMFPYKEIEKKVLHFVFNALDSLGKKIKRELDNHTFSIADYAKTQLRKTYSTSISHEMRTIDVATDLALLFHLSKGNIYGLVDNPLDMTYLEYLAVYMPCDQINLWKKEMAQTKYNNPDIKHQKQIVDDITWGYASFCADITTACGTTIYKFIKTGIIDNSSYDLFARLSKAKYPVKFSLDNATETGAFITYLIHSYLELETKYISELKKTDIVALKERERALKKNELCLNDKLLTKDDKIRELESNIEFLNSQISNLVKENESQQKEIERLIQEKAETSEGQKELVALRELMHSLQKSEIDSSTVVEASIGDIKQKIEKQKIVLVGGSPHFIKKVRLLFPDWKYIGVDNNNFPEEIIIHADYVLVFYSFCSHALYYRVMSSIERSTAQLHYLSQQVNVDKFVSQIDTLINKG